MGPQTLETKAAPARTKSAGKAWIWITAGLFVLAVAGIIGSGGYQRFQEYRLLRKARGLYEEKDFSGAILFDRRVLELAPHDIEANRLMAEMADAAGSRQSLYWRRTVSELVPSSLADHLKWADTALRLNESAMAEQALADVDAAGENTSDYHEMKGRVEESLNRISDAQAEFKTSATLDPASFRNQLDVARLELLSQDASVQNPARTKIEALSKRPELFSSAMHALINDAIARKDQAAALDMATKLKSAPDSSFEDRILYLGLLHDFQRPEFATYLADLQQQTVKNADHAASLIAWMNAHSLALLAVEWSKDFSAEVRARGSLRLELAESFGMLGDWTSLKAITSGASWGQFEFMRQAILARLARHEDDETAWQNHWDAAIRSAASTPEALAALARAGVAWGWADDSEDILWSVAQGSYDQHWALNALFRQFYATHSTRNLLKVVSRMYELTPSDPWTRHNLAAIELLLQSNVPQGVQLSHDLYLSDPQNPTYASTYAFGLHLMGQSDQAAKILKSVPSALLQDPVHALYYGAILAATGDSGAEASKYLDLAETGDLFPEEHIILGQARDQLVRRPLRGGASPSAR